MINSDKQKRPPTVVGGEHRRQIKNITELVFKKPEKRKENNVAKIQRKQLKAYPSLLTQEVNEVNKLTMKGKLEMENCYQTHKNNKTRKEGEHMSVMKTLVIVLFSLVLCSSAVAALDEKPDLVLNLSVEKQVIVKDEGGKTKIEWQEDNVTDPGDILRYTIHYVNKGAAEARNAVIVDPVPEGTFYIDNSADGKSSFITFSLDGKTFQTPQILTYKVKQDDGTEIEYKATPEMYTHINWKLLKPVPPGGSGTLNFKVKVK